jgi:N-acetylmuramoyl-L-alanine amidase
MVKKAFIDLSHGGSDPGAVANGLQEKNVVLEIGKYMNEMLKSYEGIEWKFSRLDDRTLTLDQRTDMANAWGADIFVSIHINSGGGYGFESFIYNGDWSTKNGTIAMQNYMHGILMKHMGSFFYDRGKKQANYHVLRESKMKAILTENGFIDNSRDAAILKDRTKLMIIAAAHVEAITGFLGVKKKTEQQGVKKVEQRVPGPFKDVPADHWAVGEIKLMKELGIIKGHADGTFGLGENVTREQLAVILARLYKKLTS